MVQMTAAAPARFPDISELGFDASLERIRLLASRAAARAAGRLADSDALGARLRELETSVQDTGLEVSRLRLEPDEALFLWAVVGATVDPTLALQLAQLGPRDGRLGISLAQFVALAGLDPMRGRRLARTVLAAHPLVRWRLIEPVDERPMTVETAWVAPARVVSFLAGDDTIDAALSLVEPPLRPVTDATFDSLCARLDELASAEEPCAIVLRGRHGVGRRTLVRTALGRPVVALDVHRLGREPRALADGLAALGRETVLGGALPIIVGAEDMAGGEPDAEARRRELIRFIDGCTSHVFVATTMPLPRLAVARRVFRLEVPIPEPATRSDLWRHELGPDDQAVAKGALRFQLGPGGIRDAVAGARANAAAARRPITAADLAEGVRATVEERLQGLALRHTTSLGWQDIVLTSDTRAQVDILMSRVRNAYQVLETWGFRRHLPGPGVAALFSGPPGTGKTMLASVIARMLGLELYRVDLAQITSKWVGETEKQLDLVFSAAETGHVMLLFDEADSLFGKRTEVKGATERYANLEVNFLLQRIESFAGVAILTTNMDGSLDPALRRRLAAHIRFLHPEEDERRELWRRLMPKAAPCAPKLDVAPLARDFPAFAGAQIRNALTTAAFLAANGGTQITQGLLRTAANQEAQAMGRLVAGAPR